MQQKGMEGKSHSRVHVSLVQGSRGGALILEHLGLFFWALLSGL